ncbi:FG-GAP repeat protein [Streptomyces sp. NPDC092370]|uniref:FG-GAP repeat protein n=1 Tax=Streptomyces sp. NPDC092370 TaxID=3366016 RepID=UPI0037FA469B
MLCPADSHAAFGYTLRLRDLTADGKADLAVGAANGALLMPGTGTVPTKTGAIVLPEPGGTLPD